MLDLLDLAASNDALLATFDTRIVTTAVPSGAEVAFLDPVSTPGQSDQE